MLENEMLNNNEIIGDNDNTRSEEEIKAPMQAAMMAPFAAAVSDGGPTSGKFKPSEPENSSINIPDVRTEVITDPFLQVENVNENIQLSNGSLDYTVTEFALPGKNGLDLVIQRRYDSSAASTEKAIVDQDKDKMHYWYMTDNRGNRLFTEGYYSNWYTCMADSDSASKISIYNDGRHNGIRKTTAKDVKYCFTSKALNNHMVDTYGLGCGWSFAFPSIEKTKSPDPHSSLLKDNWYKTLHMGDGRSFQIQNSGNPVIPTSNVSNDPTSGLDKQYLNEVIIKRKTDSSNQQYYEVTLKNQTRYIFDTADRLSRIIDRFETNAIEFYYNDTANTRRITAIKDTFGRMVYFEKTANGMVLKAGSGEKIAEYTRNSNNTLGSVKRYIDNTRYQLTSYEYYDPNSQVARENLVSRWIETDVYLKYNNLKSVTYPSGKKSYFDYDLKTEYSSGLVNDPDRPYAMDISNKEGPIRQFFTVVQRYDIDELGRTVNLSKYEYSFDEKQKYIQSATNTTNNVKTVNTFNDEHMCTNETTYVDNKLYAVKNTTYNLYAPVSETELYPTDYKLPTKVESYYYDVNNTAAGCISKVEEFTYTTDRKANIAVYKYTYYNAANAIEAEDIQYFEYDPNYSIQTKKTYKKDDTTTIIEETILRTDGKLPFSERLNYKEGGTVTLKNRTDYLYDANNVCEIRNWFSAAQYTITRFEYGAMTAAPTKASKIQDSYSSIDIFEYDWFGRKISEINPNGAKTQYNLDYLGRVYKQINPDLSFKTINYNDSANKVTIIDENNYPAEYNYTVLGQIKSIILPDKNMALCSFTYDQFGKTINERTYYKANDIKATTTYFYDSLDRVSKKQTTGRGVNYEEQYVYNDIYDHKYSRVETTVVGDINAETMKATEYTDVLGNVVKKGIVINGTEHVDRYWYNMVGNCVKVLTSADYSKGLSHTALMKYDCYGNTIEETDTENNKISMVYDDLGRISATRDKKANKISAGNNELYIYGTLGRLTSHIIYLDSGLPSGRYIRSNYLYDTAGNLTEVEAEDYTTQLSYIKEYKYNSRNWLERVSSKDGNNTISTDYEYDKRGQVLRMYTGVLNGSRTGARKVEYTYDRFGNVLTYTDAMGKKEVNRYDDLGILLSKTDRYGNVFSYTYDALDRPLTVSVTEKASGKTLEQKFSYTKTGQKYSEANETLTTLYKYNSQGLPVRITESDGNEKVYEYDITGLRKMFYLLKSGSEQIRQRYEYNTLLQLSGVYSGSEKIAEYMYDVNGCCTQKVYPNGIKAVQTYDRINRLESISEYKGNVLVDKKYLIYHDDGILKEKQDINRKPLNIYTYDKHRRLVIEEDKTNNIKIEYKYDRYGNRIEQISRHDGIESTTKYSYDAANKLLKEQATDRRIASPENIMDTTVTYQYDENGSQTIEERERTMPLQSHYWSSIGFSKGLEVIEKRIYNGFGQLVRVIKDETDVEFTYKPDGMRYQKTVDNKAVTHVWDGTSIVLETNAGGAVRAKYLRGAQLIAMVLDNSPQYYTQDDHGNIEKLYDRYGNLLKKYKYTAFGEELGENEKDPNPFRYCGEYWDKEIKNVYLRARYYSPRTGRFASEDSVREKKVNIFEMEGSYQDVKLTGGVYRDDEKGQYVVADPRQYNYYNYCYNDPLKYTDAGGNIPFLLITAAAGAVIGGVAGAIYSYSTTGEVNLETVGKGALIGGAVGLVGGAGVALVAAGSATASTGAVVAGLGFGGAAAGTAAATAATTQSEEIANAAEAAQQTFSSNSYNVSELFKTQADSITKTTGTSIQTFKDIIINNGPNAVEPIKVFVRDGMAMIADGHHRFQAFVELGYTRVPIQYIHEAQLKGVTILDTAKKMIEAAFK